VAGRVKIRWGFSPYRAVRSPESLKAVTVVTGRWNKEIPVSRFVITITPDTADATDPASAQTTVRVDTSTGHTRITELTVRAADGGGLAPADLPALDLDLLVRALAAPSTVRTLPTNEAPADVVHVASPAEMAEAVEPSEVAAEPAGAARGRAAKRTGARKAAGRAARKAADDTDPDTDSAAGTGRKAATAKATRAKTTRAKATRAKATRAKTTRAKATRAKATRAKATGAAATGRARTAAAGERQTRAYRRMPDPAEVLAAYAQAGSITGLAEHYGVPRHTANGWARRLRQQGHAIGRS
jgi:hypothetical protein